jgi:hypothetical protein
MPGIAEGHRPARMGVGSMTSVIVLGAIVLLLYLFIRLCATTGAWLSGARYRS